MKLKDGDQARNFEANDLDGNLVRVGDEDGILLLTFYRYASCPLCNMRVAELRREQPWLERMGVRPVAVFQSPEASIRRYVGRQKPWFRIVPDPDQTLYRLYDVTPSWLGAAWSLIVRLPSVLRAVIGKGYWPGAIEGDMHMLPADFLIGPDGRILRAFYGRDIGDHLPLGEIERVLAGDAQRRDAKNVEIRQPS